jgi:hypothetical protein
MTGVFVNVNRQGQEVEVAMFETMASFMLVEHANGAMFDPAGARDLPADSCADSQAVPDQRRLEPILLPHAELPRGSIFRLPPRRVCR